MRVISRLNRSNIGEMSNDWQQDVHRNWLDEFHPSEPKDVIIRFDIYNISNVDTVKQTFSCEFAIETSWEAAEPEIRDKQGITNKEIDWSTIWNPRLTFKNAAHISRFEVSHRVSLTLSQRLDGRYCHNMNAKTWLTARIEVSGLFTIKMSLEQFPFDQQKLYLLVQSKWRHSWVRFLPHPMLSYRSIVNLEYASSLETEYWLDPLPQHLFTMNKDQRHVPQTKRWDSEGLGIVKTRAANCKVCAMSEDTPSIPFHTDTRHGGSGKSYPLAPLCISVARKPSYYLWNIVFPTFWIVLAAAISMFIETDDSAALIDARTQVTLTTLLTLVAVKFVVAGDLPNASYVTWLDAYILVGFFLIALVAIENVVISMIDDRDDRLFLDTICLAVFSGLWLGLHLVAAIYLYPRRVWKALKDGAGHASTSKLAFE